MTMKLVTATDAVRSVSDGATIIVGGSGAGHAVPQGFIDALASVFASEGHPRDLTTVRVVGIGDFGDVGFSQLALPGLMRRTIGSNIGNEPRLGELVRRGEVEAYSFPQGVLSQLCREIAAGRPGLITKVGLDTYADPRHTGGKQGAASQDLVEVIELAGEEWLFYHSFPIDVAIIRGSTIDEDGNLSMEREAVRGEMLAMAMAAHNSGGRVIAQAGEMVPRRSLAPRTIEVPGALIDFAFLVPDQRQTYATEYSPGLAGEALVEPRSDVQPSRLDARKAMARRSLLEFKPGHIGNLGFGVSQDIGTIAEEEGVAGELVLTVEQGVFGGVPLSGPDGGAGYNYQALIDQPAMFDFYDGGGLDIASLSFAEVDAMGHVNVHAFGDRLRGPGGFPNISRGAKKVCFVGTLTTGGLRTSINGGRISIDSEGSVQRFVDRVREVTFNADEARKRGQEVLYITERAVFRLDSEGITMVEIAAGLDPAADVIAHMGFRPRIAADLEQIDPMVFSEGKMGLRDRLAGED